MNKVLSIALTSLILFYIIGYKVVFIALHYKVDKAMNQRLETDNFSPEETVTIKIPVNLPYPITNEGFQNANGDFEHEGEFYHLVKQKIEQDTLYVVCVRNIAKSTIHTRMTEFENLVNSLPSKESKKSYKILKTFIKDYIPTKSAIDQIYGGYFTESSYCQIENVYFSASYSPDTPPPEAFI